MLDELAAIVICDGPGCLNVYRVIVSGPAGNGKVALKFHGRSFLNSRLPDDLPTAMEFLAGNHFCSSKCEKALLAEIDKEGREHGKEKQSGDDRSELRGQSPSGLDLGETSQGEG